MNQRGFAPVLILVIIAGILIIGEIWYAAHQSNIRPQVQQNFPTVRTNANLAATTTTNSLTATSNATSSWKTYTNQLYGFTFRYPSDWNYSEWGVPLFVSFYPPGRQENEPYGYLGDFIFASRPNPKNLSLHDYYQQSMGLFNSSTKQTLMTINGNELEKFENVNSSITPNSMYIIRGNGNGNDEIIEATVFNNEDLFNSILSTFQFTHSTTQWTTVSPGGLFTMRLPEELQIIDVSVATDTYATRVFNIRFNKPGTPDTLIVGRIFLYTPQQWTDAQQAEVVPSVLIKTDKFVYAYTGSASNSDPNFAKAIATFKAAQ